MNVFGHESQWVKVRRIHPLGAMNIHRTFSCQTLEIVIEIFLDPKRSTDCLLTHIALPRALPAGVDKKEHQSTTAAIEI